MMTCFVRSLSILAVLAVSAFSAKADGDNAVLFWQLLNPEVLQVDGETVKTVAEMMNDGDVTHVRVQAYTREVVEEIERFTGQGYLSFYRTDTPTAPDPEFQSVKISDGTKPDTEAGHVYPMWASIGEFFDEDIYLGLELGRWEGDDWIVAASGDRESIIELFGDGDKFIATEELFSHLTTPWDGGAFSVPEPSSGLMIALGLALFGLRRKGDLS